jgi:hypothetical protein
MIDNLVQRSEGLEQQDYQQIFQYHPSAVLTLHKKDNIPSEALNSINYDDFLQSGDDLASTFAGLSAKWFSKMSGDDLNHHGRKLLNSYSDMHSANKLQSDKYHTAVENAFKYMHKSLTQEDLNRILNKSTDSTLKNQIFQTALKYGVGGKSRPSLFGQCVHACV